ncbi:TetR/AcrR family transcriptional regulator [Parvibaculum sp.]|uniref:TetR/AcrR family transcriptional regulator n=1 Tax=Parvibaculum sp. TaxID=2024848 RepID=UPI00329742FA
MTSKGKRQDGKKPARKVGRPAAEGPNEAKRDAIAAAALKLFSQSGVAAVSNRDLGEAAGINPALIYYYFEDKEDLFQFAVRKALSDALAAYDEIKKEKGGVGDLDAWLSSNLLLFGELTRFLKVILDYAHSGQRSEQTDAAISRFYETETGLIAHALEDEGAGAGEAEDLAQLVSVFLDGIMVARVIRPDVDSERLIELMRGLLQGKLR